MKVITDVAHVSNIVVLSQLSCWFCGWRAARPHPPYLDGRICHLSEVGLHSYGLFTLQGQKNAINTT